MKKVVLEMNKKIILVQVTIDKNHLKVANWIGEWKDFYFRLKFSYAIMMLDRISSKWSRRVYVELKYEFRYGCFHFRRFLIPNLEDRFGDSNMIFMLRIIVIGWGKFICLKIMSLKWSCYHVFQKLLLSKYTIVFMLQPKSTQKQKDWMKQTGTHIDINKSEDHAKSMRDRLKLIIMANDGNSMF